jgi:hypothetical protein
MVRSQYYGLSHGPQLTRSRSKDNKEDLTKDISHKVLFPMNPKLDRRISKADDKKVSVRSKNSNFFDTPTMDNKNNNDSPSLDLKDVQYINLETVITEKIDKTQKDSLRMEMSVPT